MQVNRKRTIVGGLLACVALASGSLVAAWLTRSYCVRLSCFQAAAAAEDGLLWVDVPLQRRLQSTSGRVAVRVFTRDATLGTASIPEVWRSGDYFMKPTRDLVRELKRQRGASTMLVAGFGWVLDDGYHASGLPGYTLRKFRLITPIWFMLAAWIAIGLGLRRQRQFGLRFLMLATAVLAGLLWYIVVPVS
jgi:hypothetical protein